MIVADFITYCKWNNDDRYLPCKSCKFC